MLQITLTFLWLSRALLSFKLYSMSSISFEVSLCQLHSNKSSLIANCHHQSDDIIMQI